MEVKAALRCRAMTWRKRSIAVVTLVMLWSLSAMQSGASQRYGLYRGVNFGNTLEAPNYEGEWGYTILDPYFGYLAEAGFDHVRIPIRWNAYADRDDPFTLADDIFQRVSHLVTYGLEHGLTIIVNIHHYDELMDRPAEHKERFLAIWRQVAEHFQHFPDSLIFEILNEPHGNLRFDTWNNYQRQALGVIRETNPTRPVIVTGANWGGLQGLLLLDVPDDAHIIASFHYYDPFAFTHQGAGWVSGMNQHIGREWTGSSAEQLAVQRDLDRALRWAKQRDIPLYLGEFGAYSRADLASRVRWTDFVARQAEERGIGWTYWEFGAGFGIYDPSRQRWNYQLLEALIPPLDRPPAVSESLLSLGKPVFASHNQEQGYRVVDGTTSLWQADGEGPFSFVVDLEEEQLVTRWLVEHGGASPIVWSDQAGESGLNSSSFTVEASVDGTHWTMLAQVSGNKANVSEGRVPPVPARYVRLQIVEPTSVATMKTARVVGVHVYGMAP